MYIQIYDQLSMWCRTLRSMQTSHHCHLQKAKWLSVILLKTSIDLHFLGLSIENRCKDFPIASHRRSRKIFALISHTALRRRFASRVVRTYRLQRWRCIYVAVHNIVHAPARAGAWICLPNPLSIGRCISHCICFFFNLVTYFPSRALQNE